MDARLNLYTSPSAGKVLHHFMSVGRALKESPLPAVTRELVALSVSRINGCAACIDMHTSSRRTVRNGGSSRHGSSAP